MKRDLGELELVRLIVHKVPQRISKQKYKEVKKAAELAGTEIPRDDAGIEYSEVESPLTPQTKNYFTERIQTSLRTHTMYATFNPDCESPVVAQATHQCLNDPTVDFVEQSKAIAQHLHKCQNASNSGGLVLVAQSLIERVPAIAILKLEEESAIQFKRELREDKPTFTLTHLDDLTMTQNTKVFKAGLFVREGNTVAEIEGHVSDKQQSPVDSGGVGIAEFFLRDFLGCTLRDDPATQTLQLFDLGMRWLNSEEISDPQQKADYSEAFRTRMRNNLETFSIEEYVEQDLRPEHQDGFLNFLGDNGITDRTILKNTQHLTSRLKHAVWEFTNGVRVSYPEGAFRDHYVSVEEGENGQTILRVVGQTKKVK